MLPHSNRRPEGACICEDVIVPRRHLVVHFADWRDFLLVTVFNSITHSFPLPRNTPSRYIVIENGIPLPYHILDLGLDNPLQRAKITGWLQKAVIG